MSATGLNKKQCITCKKGGGVVTCDGCQQTFCGKHINEHRQELQKGLDEITQEHDLFQQELQQSTLDASPMLKKIDEWERDSIARIIAAAETARTKLKEIIEQMKINLSKPCGEMALVLRSSCEADDFSELDLEQWKKQLNDFRLNLMSPFECKFIRDKGRHIDLMKLEYNDSTKTQQEDSTTQNSNATSKNVDLQEKFLQKLGSVHISKDADLATRGASSFDDVYLRGRFLYSADCYQIRFKIEYFTPPYRIFIGCMSSTTDLKQEAYRTSDAVGWFGYNQVYQFGYCISDCQKTGYNSTKIQVNDVLHLTLDCTKKLIRLFHERLDKTHTLSVNQNLTPFPWQFLIVLSNPGDSIRILSNT